MRSILALLIASTCVLAPSVSVTAAQAYDLCHNRVASNPQIERDTDAAARMLRDGQSDFHDRWKQYTDGLKKATNYPADQDKYNIVLQVVMTAMYCKDPDDVKLVTSPKDLRPDGPLNFTIDFSKVNTDSVYETVKNHSPTPSVIKQVDDEMNKVIGAEDRQKAASQFNARAQEDNQPMRLIVDQKDDQLHLQAR